jgi:hypothetical protein
MDVPKSPNRRATWPPREAQVRASSMSKHLEKLAQNLATDDLTATVTVDFTKTEVIVGVATPPKSEGAAPGRWMPRGRWTASHGRSVDADAQGSAGVLEEEEDLVRPRAVSEGAQRGGSSVSALSRALSGGQITPAQVLVSH